MQNPFFKALPAYFGGKRRLAPLIFALLNQAVPRSHWRDLKLLDPFLGGGSVSLYAKAQGFDVCCNDLARRSAVIGQAMIANSTVKLTPAVLAEVLRNPSDEYGHVAEQQFSPSVFAKKHAQLLDRTLHNAAGLPEPLRSLALVLIVKWLLRIQPMSQLRGTDARAAYEGDLDRVSPHRLRHYLEAEKLLRPKAWLELMADVNAGVFPGKGEAQQGDALTFIYTHPADVVYLDAPYPATTSYEGEYAVLDRLLEGETREVSGFSKSADLLSKLFEVCISVPVWMVSLNNAALDLAQLEDLIRSYRPNVHSVEVSYRHLGSIASEEKNATNREFVVLAW